MATKKTAKTTKKVSKVKKTVTPQDIKVETNNTKEKSFLSKNTLSNLANYRASKKFYIVLLLLALVLLAYLKKDWLVAASVNGSPVSNLELQSKLNSQFKEQTLSQMINEKLILQEAQKKGVVITENDIDEKIKELENNLGGAEVLDSLLSQQGQTRNSIRGQLKVQMTIEKLYVNEASVSAQEVNDFITQNPDALTATESAGQYKEAEEVLSQQKLSQIFNQKFQELKNNANIQIY